MKALLMEDEAVSALSERLSARAADPEKLAGAANPLYDSLDDSQKRRFAVLFHRPHGPRPLAPLARRGLAARLSPPTFLHEPVRTRALAFGRHSIAVRPDMAGRGRLCHNRKLGRRA